MQKRTAPLQAHELLGEPSLTALLSDPVMVTLWRADHIDPDAARQLFADTREKLAQRSPDDERFGEHLSKRPAKRSAKRTGKRGRSADHAYQEDGALALT
jgi:hypothetical protein